MKQWSSWRSVTAAVFALSLSHSVAQQWKAELPTVEKAGLHRIVLSPEMVGRSREDLGDVQLVDSAARAIPYVLEVAEEAESVETMRDFDILRNDVVGKQTILEFSSTKALPVVHDISLRIRNAQVRKEVGLSGSDDGFRWFFIKKDILQLSGGGSETSALRMIDLPASDYLFYRLVLNDSLTEPVQVLNVQWLGSAERRPTLTPINDAHWAQFEDAETQHLELIVPYTATVDQMVITVGDSGDYHRDCRLLVRRNSFEYERGKRRSVSRMEQVAAFALTSRTLNTVEILGLREDTFAIVIQNGDDLPLSIKNVRCFQRERSLRAELRLGMHYTLMTGDPKKSAPQYDIVHFKDKLPEPIATISHGPLIALATTPEAGPSIAPSRWWIWAGLVAVLGIVGFMAVRMLREPQQQNG